MLTYNTIWIQKTIKLQKTIKYVEERSTVYDVKEKAQLPCMEDAAVMQFLEVAAQPCGLLIAT